MTSNCSSSLNFCGDPREEVPQIPNLENEERKPTIVSLVISKDSITAIVRQEVGVYIPVQRGDHGVEREWGSIMVILAPDFASVVSLVWFFAIGVVDGDDDIQNPGQNR